jgi:hypothetical protein
VLGLTDGEDRNKMFNAPLANRRICLVCGWLSWDESCFPASSGQVSNTGKVIVQIGFGNADLPQDLVGYQLAAPNQPRTLSGLTFRCLAVSVTDSRGDIGMVFGVEGCLGPARKARANSGGQINGHPICDRAGDARWSIRNCAAGQLQETAQVVSRLCHSMPRARLHKCAAGCLSG